MAATHGLEAAHTGSLIFLGCAVVAIQQTATASISINMFGKAKRGTSTIVEAGGVCDPNTAARTLRTKGGV